MIQNPYGYGFYPGFMFPQQNSQQYFNPPTPTTPHPTKIVSDMSSITADMVSMDGKSVFLKDDGSEVYVKQWTPQGNISTNVYKLDNEALSAETINSIPKGEKSLEKAISELIDSRFDKLEKLIKPGRSKKEVVENEQ